MVRLIFFDILKSSQNVLKTFPSKFLPLSVMDQRDPNLGFRIGISISPWVFFIVSFAMSSRIVILSSPFYFDVKKTSNHFQFFYFPKKSRF